MLHLRSALTGSCWLLSGEQTEEGAGVEAGRSRGRLLKGIG